MNLDGQIRPSLGTVQLTSRGPFGQISAVLLFPQYRLSEKLSAQHVQTARKIGLLPIFITLVMMLARRTTPGPGLWSALGLSISLELLLWGCYAICYDRELKTKTATYLALTSDSWFPLFLFTIQNLFVLIAVAVLWLTLEELGFPATLWLDVNLMLLVLLIPLCRLLLEIERVTDSPAWSMVSEGARYLGVILAVVWISATITLFMAPPGTPMPHDLYPIAVVLWVVTTLIVAVMIMLFADHFLRLKKG